MTLNADADDVDDADGADDAVDADDAHETHDDAAEHDDDVCVHVFDDMFKFLQVNYWYILRSCAYSFTSCR